MSTSRYSKSDISDITSPSRTDDYPEPCMKLQFPPHPENTRRWTSVKISIISGLFIVDALALIGASNIGEAITFALLMLVNLWALSHTH